MLQKSKILRSRDEWKSKAVQRSAEIREHRKIQKRYQTKIAELKMQIDEMKEQADESKKN